jgi:hypothetical protein
VIILDWCNFGGNDSRTLLLVLCVVQCETPKWLSAQAKRQRRLTYAEDHRWLRQNMAVGTAGLRPMPMARPSA